MINSITQQDMKNAILDSIGEAVILVDPNGRIIKNCNSVTEELFGYTQEELIGKETSILHVNREHYEHFGSESERVLKTSQVYKGEFKMKRKDGGILHTYHTVSSLNEGLGWEDGVVSVIRDISAQKQAERELMNHKKEKSILLAEVHHRVKNNLAIIAGLLYMQIESSVNKSVVESLKTSYCRLQSIAQVHEQLYKEAELDSNISLCTYLHEMAESVDNIILLPEKTIKIDIDCDSLTIPLVQAVPLGLLVSELLVNSFKHAFRKRKKGTVKIVSKMREYKLLLKVSDNGVGLPEEFSLDSGSIGMSIIKTLSQQLEGDLTYASEPGEGTTFSISFTVEP